MKQVNAIICSDLHLRLDTPSCRLDDFVETQKRKYKWLRELQEKHDCPVLVSGDIFHHWKPSPELLSFALENLPDRMICIAGQHDLEAHNLANIKRSGIYALAAAGKITLLNADDECDDNRIIYQAFPWGTALTGTDRGFGELAAVALVHRLVFQGKEPFPGAANVGGTAKAVIKQMQGFSLICTGDNHQSFFEQTDTQVLVNSGSFLRSTAAQADFKPKVYLWNATTNEVEAVEVPIESGVISRDHIQKLEERDERIEAFISKLKPAEGDSVASVNFKDNLRNYLAENNISKEITDIVWRTLE